MAIPGVFKPHYIHRKNGGKVEPCPKEGTFGDGGMLYNLPMEAFDFEKYTTKSPQISGGMFPVFNTKTVGFDLYSPFSPTKDAADVKTLLELLKSLMGVYMGAETSLRSLNPFAATRIIKINTGDIGTLDFNLTEQQKRELMRAGFQATRQYFGEPVFSHKGARTFYLKTHQNRFSIQAPKPKQTFLGRDALIHCLRDFIFEKQLTHNIFSEAWLGGKAIPPIVIAGTDKLDADEIAIAFVYKFMDRFGFVKEIDGSSKKSIRTGYEELAKMLGLETNHDTLFPKVNRTLEKIEFFENETQKPWFLVFTNANPQAFNELKLRFPSKGGALLIGTSCSQIMPAREIVFDLADFALSETPTPTTSLFTAAKVGRVKTMEFLIEEGADSKAVDDQGYTPLFHTVIHGQEDAMKWLLNNHPVNPLAKTPKGETLLHVAAQFGRYEICKYLLENTPIKSLINDKTLFIKQSASASHQDDATALHTAVNCDPDSKTKERTAIVELFLKHGANPNAVTTYFYTPLHWAAKHGNRAQAELLIQNGARYGLVVTPQIVGMLIEEIKGKIMAETGRAPTYALTFPESLMTPLNGNSHGPQSPIDIAKAYRQEDIEKYLLTLPSLSPNLISNAVTEIDAYIKDSPDEYKKKFFRALKSLIMHTGVTIEVLEESLNNVDKALLFRATLSKTNSNAAKLMAKIYSLIEGRTLTDQEMEVMVDSGRLPT